MTRLRLPRTRPRRVDLIAHAERTLYPGLPWRRYTLEQRDRTVRLAKAMLIRRGQWPVGPNEREDERRGRTAA